MTKKSKMNALAFILTNIYQIAQKQIKCTRKNYDFKIKKNVKF